MRKPKARFATVVRMPPPFRHRTTKKEPGCSPRPAAALQERTEEIMDRVQKAGDNQVERVAALEEYLTLTRPRRRDMVRCRGLDRGPRARDTSPRAGSCGSRLAPTNPHDVWVYVQAGIGYGDIGDHAGPWNG